MKASEFIVERIGTVGDFVTAFSQETGDWLTDVDKKLLGNNKDPVKTRQTLEAISTAIDGKWEDIRYDTASQYRNKTKPEDRIEFAEDLEKSLNQLLASIKITNRDPSTHRDMQVLHDSIDDTVDGSSKVSEKQISRAFDHLVAHAAKRAQQKAQPDVQEPESAQNNEYSNKVVTSGGFWGAQLKDSDEEGVYIYNEPSKQWLGFKRPIGSDGRYTRSELSADDQARFSNMYAGREDELKMLYVTMYDDKTLSVANK